MCASPSVIQIQHTCEITKTCDIGCGSPTTVSAEFDVVIPRNILDFQKVQAIGSDYYYFIKIILSNQLIV